MIKLFDYFVYLLYSNYIKFGEKDIPLFYSLGLLSIFQGLNMIMILELVNLYFHDLNFLLFDDWYLFVGSFTFLVNAYFYWYRDRFDLVKKKFKSKKFGNLKFYTILYVILSIASDVIVIYLVRESNI